MNSKKNGFALYALKMANFEANDEKMTPLGAGWRVEAKVTGKDVYIVHANHCAYEIIDGAEVISFCDDQDNSEKYLILQRSIDADAQDRKLGLDAMHIELSDQSRSGYGLINSISQAGVNFIFSPTKYGQIALGVQGEILIETSGCDVDLTRLIDALRKICSESRVNFLKENKQE